MQSLNNRKKITSGDILHVYGSLGLKIDYTVRLCLRLTDNIDINILEKAVQITSKRYPYLLLKMLYDEKEVFYVENTKPIKVLNQKEPVTLGSEETNYHVWAVCYWDDMLYFDFYHGICDGTGMYMVLSTLLYYYLDMKYGSIDNTGIRTLADKIEPEEYIDPMDNLPEIDISNTQSRNYDNIFNLVKDCGFTRCKPMLFDVTIPEKDFVRFSSANDASPGVMISILIARAIDKTFQCKDKTIIGSYIVNGRPMLNANKSHHNCVTSTTLDYSDKIKKMPFDRQCTVYRGKVFVQSDSDNVKKMLTFLSSMNKMITKSAPTFEGKSNAYSKIMGGSDNPRTYLVSYVGKWKYPSIGKYIKEFWTHVPCGFGFASEVAAINGNIFLSIHQGFKEETLINAFLEELKSNGISYTITKKEHKIPKMSFPKKIDE